MLAYDSPQREAFSTGEVSFSASRTSNLLSSFFYFSFFFLSICWILNLTAILVLKVIFTWMDGRNNANTVKSDDGVPQRIYHHLESKDNGCEQNFCGKIIFHTVSFNSILRSPIL